MASSMDLLRAIQTKDFVAAKEQFSLLVQDKMRMVLAREYQDTAKTLITKK